MPVYQISTREFRDNQATVLDMVDKGLQVILRRSRAGRSYAITPINDEELYFTPEVLAKIDKSIAQAKRGETFSMRENESLSDFLDRVNGR